jgi:hypothetical protein
MASKSRAKRQRRRGREKEHKKVIDQNRVLKSLPVNEPCRNTYAEEAVMGMSLLTAAMQIANKKSKTADKEKEDV